MATYTDNHEEAVRSQLDGELVMPGDDGWDEARRAWNLAVDQQPAAVALPESAHDVVEIVRYARARGLRVAAQGTGHNAAALSNLADTVLVKTERMRAVTIDPDDRVARVEAGVLWGEVTGPAAAHGLAPLAGSAHDVGVVGYVLGGGLSWLARRHGLAANSVVAIEIVDAEGRRLRVDHENEPDLFWALRGGGGSFGVVTALELRLYPVSELYAGVLFWPIERSGAVLHAWRDWIETVPEEVTSVGRILQLPPLPDIPEPLRGRSFVVVEAAMLGDEQWGRSLVEPLRMLEPEFDTFAMISPARLTELHMDPPGPVPGSGDHMLLRAVPGEAIDALVAAAGAGSGSPLLSVELRHLGGAVGRRAAGHGALGSIEAEFAMFAVGMAVTPEMKEAVDDHLAVVRYALGAFDAGREYLNFSERPVAASLLFDTDSHARLQRVKAEWDPEDVLHSNHPISPAS